MVANTTDHIRYCIYCGSAAKRIRKSEHILPEAIGGTLTIKEVSGSVVCHDCNNRELSLLDRELCNRSILSMIASQEIAAEMWQTWDIDHAARNLLIEAKPVWEGGELKHLVCFPQMILETAGPELRGDAEDFQQFGFEDSQRVLVKAIRGAFQRYCAGQKRSLHFERLRTRSESRGYRFPPRVYTRHSISEIASNINNQSFIVRYTTSDEKRFALRSLDRLEDGHRFNGRGQSVGSRLSEISHSYDLGVTMRALMKLGINLLAAYCQKTPVNCDTFKAVVRLIRGRCYPTPELIARNGFVRSTGIESIKADSSSHSFRLIHADGKWRFLSSFFGGRIGAFVAFPGPNLEEWNTLDVVAPLRSKDWSVNKYAIFQPMRVLVEWNDIAEIAPSLKVLNPVSRMVAERVRIHAR